MVPSSFHCHVADTVRRALYDPVHPTPLLVFLMTRWNTFGAYYKDETRSKSSNIKLGRVAV
jgi:uncharacterized protein YqjF (DUF2071 family)